MKINTYQEACIDRHIGIVAGHTEHMITVEEAKQILVDLSKALHQIEPPENNDAYFENYFNLFLKDVVDIKTCAIIAMKNVERDTRHEAAEIAQKAISEIMNMRHRA